ncbi:MAG TPA: ComEC/Rec2 family competence protein, partial [Candidatus Saccharimonas sp.]|nr:ComEC/Rec2 family competence protein [Candidatus Saccharimonas sp.]
VSDDPVADPRGFTSFHAGGLRADPGTPGAGQVLPGTILVRLPRGNLHRGYLVHLEGRLRPPYLSGPPELSYPHLAIISTQQSWLERLRQRFFVGVKTALPEPLASFGLGLLVGVRALIPKPLQNELALVGLSHLVAVSGYNLTIIIAATHRLLQRWGRGLALVVSLWLIGGFLVVTGATASIVRASLVAVLVLLAAYYGRRFHPVTLLLLVAGATAAFNPAYLSDLGWLLSFLAFFGIMVVAPAVEARLGHPKWLAAKLFIESTTAQAMTVPLIMFAFANFSVVAPLTNLLILPLVPLAMLLTFIAGLAGMIVPAFAGWFAWPAQLLLGFMLDLIDAFAALPWAGLTLGLDTAGLIALYGLILAAVIILVGLNRRRAAVMV